MRVLWITNVELNMIAASHSSNVVVGGWLNTVASQISDINDIELIIACRVNGVEYSKRNINGIFFYSFSTNISEDAARSLIKTVHPDVVHIWGTEYEHAYIFAKVLSELGLVKQTVVSIQGLVSIYAKHYCDGLPKTVFRRTIKEVLKHSGIIDKQEEMRRKGELEKKTLRLLSHCIGRTDWDLACVRQINPNMHYHYCNETLREGFYDKSWSIDRCGLHTIFFSQAHYPIKGFHNLLEAMPIIREFYPDTKVRVVGRNPISGTKLIRSIKIGAYEKYLKSLISIGDLAECITWLGRLTEEQMIEEYLNANVFVCASNIENSSNSIGEAMLLGVPVVSSDVGGIKSLMHHNIEGILYQGTAPYMLADAVIRVFDNNEFASYLGKNAQERAYTTHNKTKNLSELLAIYNGLNS